MLGLVQVERILFPCPPQIRLSPPLRFACKPGLEFPVKGCCAPLPGFFFAGKKGISPQRFLAVLDANAGRGATTGGLDAVLWMLRTGAPWKDLPYKAPRPHHGRRPPRLRLGGLLQQRKTGPAGDLWGAGGKGESGQKYDGGAGSGHAHRIFAGLHGG